MNKTKKNKHTKKNKLVYYSGIGCKKDNKHTKKEFMKIAKKHFNDCKSKKCKKNKACINRKNISKKLLKGINIDINDPKNNYLENIKNCDKCKKKHKCDFKEYIKYSGAKYK